MTVDIKRIDSRAQLESFVRKMFESIDPEYAKKRASDRIRDLETYDWYNAQDIICSFKPQCDIWFQVPDRANSYISVGFYFKHHITDECEERWRKEGKKEYCKSCGGYIPLLKQKIDLRKFFDTNEGIFYESNGKKIIYNKVFFADEADTYGTENNFCIRFDRPFKF